MTVLGSDQIVDVYKIGDESSVSAVKVNYFDSRMDGILHF